ncbi:unnamed protein product [Caenorhabditis sp. 36 PRJEB53466]|nr:unnamed protein product [Caenorhabditis sp. 36 PRJEB53466]
MKKTSATASDKVLQDPERALQRAQHILVVQDATAPGSYIHHRVLHMLHRYSHVPSTLVMNKIDLVMRKSDLLPLVEILTNGQLADNQLIATKPAQIGRLGKSLSTHTPSPSTVIPTDEKWKSRFRELIQKPTWQCSYAETRSLFRTICGWSGFERVFFVSSLTGEGVDELREHLMGISPEGDWRMENGMPTRESAQQLCMDSIRAAVLDTTPSDVAYTVSVRIAEWQEQGEVLQIVGEIRCQKARDGTLIIGKGGRRISEIGRRVNEHLHSLFQRQLGERRSKVFAKEFVVLILIILESLRLADFIGVPRLLTKLREERFKSIQTEMQYLYVHRCILEYLMMMMHPKSEIFQYLIRIFPNPFGTVP